jgi:carbon monoxide dehydrogenase subunit G
MASVWKEVLISAPSEDVWDAVRDIGALHSRLVPGFVTDTRLEDGARVVTFANGLSVRELVVGIDDAHRRVAWSAVGTPMTHHNGSFQVFDDGRGATRGVWIADLLPDEMAPALADMMDQGLAAMKAAFE